MSYATIPDLILRFGELQIVQLTDRADPPAGLVDDQVAGDALAYADSTINGYIGARYRLPLTQAQPVLKSLALDLAWYQLQREPTKDAIDRYAAAIRSLKDIGSGGLVLMGEAGATSAEPAGRDDQVVMQSAERLFTRDSMRSL